MAWEKIGRAPAGEPIVKWDPATYQPGANHDHQVYKGVPVRTCAACGWPTGMAFHHYPESSGMPERNVWQVKCDSPDCGLRMLSYVSMDDAVATWNRRPAIDHPVDFDRKRYFWETVLIMLVGVVILAITLLTAKAGTKWAGGFF